MFIVNVQILESYFLLLFIELRKAVVLLQFPLKGFVFVSAATLHGSWKTGSRNRKKAKTCPHVPFTAGSQKRCGGLL